MSTFKSHLVALVSAAALAFGAVAPAAAMDNDDLAALLMLLGRGSAGIETNRAPQYLGRPGQGYWGNDDQRHPFFLNDREERWQHWNSDRRHDRRVIPSQCVFPLRTKDGVRNVVPPRCLNDYGYDQPLPRECRMDIRISGDRRLLYGATCLKNKGYRIAGYR